jgi:putative protease
MVDNHGTAAALLRALPGISLAGAAGLNIFNHAAVEDAGPAFGLLTLSSELSRDEIRTLIRELPAGCRHPVPALVVQGSCEAMITEDCLTRLVLSCREPAGDRDVTRRFTGIRDETGHLFPVRSDGQCRTRIGNAAELCLIDRLPEIRAAGIREVAVDVRGKPPAYVHEMTRIYRSAVDLTDTAGQSGTPAQELAVLREQVKQIAFGGITTGHFLRGLVE